MTTQYTYDSVKLINKSIIANFLEPIKDDSTKLRKFTITTKLVSSTPIDETKKLAKILKARSTKIGILCNPERLYKPDDTLKPLVEEQSQFVDNLYQLQSLLPLFYKNEDDEHAEFFLKKLDESYLSLLDGVKDFCDELDNLIDSRDGEDNSNENRLTSIGKIWASCDALDDLSNKKSLGVLCGNVRASCNMIDDALMDVKEWFEEPTLGHDLLLDDDFSDEEEEENVSGNDDEDTEAIEKVRVFLKSWEGNIKLIKLLMSSFVASVSGTSKTKGSDLNELEILHRKVVEEIDEFLSDVFMSDNSFSVDDFDENTKVLNNNLTKMVKTIKKINASDPKKLKWIDVWENKYFQKS